MKNYLLFVLLILILASVDHPTIAEPRAQLYDKLMSFLGDSTKVQTNRKAERVLERVKKRLRMSEQQESYIQRQLASDDKMASFNSRYCKQNELNSFLYGDELRQVCRIIHEETTK